MKRVIKDTLRGARFAVRELIHSIPDEFPGHELASLADDVFGSVSSRLRTLHQGEEPGLEDIFQQLIRLPSSSTPGFARLFCRNYGRLSFEYLKFHGFGNALLAETAFNRAAEAVRVVHLRNEPIPSQAETLALAAIACMRAHPVVALGSSDPASDLVVGRLLTIERVDALMAFAIALSLLAFAAGNSRSPDALFRSASQIVAADHAKFQACLTTANPVMALGQHLESLARFVP